MVLGQTAVHLELAQVAHVRLLVLAKRDLAHNGRPLQLEGQVLGRVVRRAGKGNCLINILAIKQVIGGYCGFYGK